MAKEVIRVQNLIRIRCKRVFKFNFPSYDVELISNGKKKGRQRSRKVALQLREADLRLSYTQLLVTALIDWYFFLAGYTYIL